MFNRTTELLLERSQPLSEENRSLRRLLQNADEQLSTLNSAITNEQAFRGKSSYIIDRFKEQKEVFSDLERSLTNTNRMIREIEGQMQSLRVEHSNFQNEGLKVFRAIPADCGK